MVHNAFVEDETVLGTGQVLLEQVIRVDDADVSVEEEEPRVAGLDHEMRHDAVPLEHELEGGQRRGGTSTHILMGALPAVVGVLGYVEDIEGVGLEPGIALESGPGQEVLRPMADALHHHHNSYILAGI